MPITAKLSKAFYAKVGEQVANELVDWFNAVDATYRSELRETNELNFARFDAKLDARFAQSDATWEARFAQSDARWEARFAQVDIRFAQSEARMLRWMFAFWSTLVMAILFN